MGVKRVMPCIPRLLIVKVPPAKSSGCSCPARARATNLWLSVINQDYVGDINIRPASRYFNPFRVLAFLTEQEIRNLVQAGEQALQAVFSREGYTVRRVPTEHAGGKWQLRYPSAGGQGGKPR